MAHDYGFTFLNTEAIYHGFTTDAQAQSILTWLGGERAVSGDTSTDGFARLSYGEPIKLEKDFPLRSIRKE